MFNDSDLQRYAERQRVANQFKADLALRSALEEEKVKSKNKQLLQDSVNSTALAQEQLQQTGASSRQTQQLDFQKPTRDADVKQTNAKTVGINLNNAFQTAVQPKMINEVGAKVDASIAQSNRFRTYYTGEQAKDERAAILSGFDVSKTGVSNKENYFDPIFGRGNLQSDLDALKASDAAIRNNQNVQPDFVGVPATATNPTTVNNAAPRITADQLSTLSTGKLPNQRKKLQAI